MEQFTQNVSYHVSQHKFIDDCVKLTCDIDTGNGINPLWWKNHLLHWRIAKKSSKKLQQRKQEAHIVISSSFSTLKFHTQNLCLHSKLVSQDGYWSHNRHWLEHIDLCTHRPLIISCFWFFVFVVEFYKLLTMFTMGRVFPVPRIWNNVSMTGFIDAKN